jgi:hypothetical protein
MKKIFKILISIGVTYITGFFLVAPWVNISPYPLDILPYSIHNNFYRPILRISGPDGYLLKLWIANADFWGMPLIQETSPNRKDN